MCAKFQGVFGLYVEISQFCAKVRVVAERKRSGEMWCLEGEGKENLSREKRGKRTRVLSRKNMSLPPFFDKSLAVKR